MSKTKPDWTKLGTLQRCEQEYVHRHVSMLAPTSAVSASAHFGQMVHHGVRALYDGKSVAVAQQVTLDAWESSMAGIIVARTIDGTGTWSCAICGFGWEGKRGAPHWCKSLGATSDKKPLPIMDDKKTWLRPVQATAIVAAYAGAYIGTQPYECVWNEGYAESATECALPDRAVRAKADGKLYAMDLKTTGMYVSRNWQRSFEHSQQVAMQLDVLEATLGERVEGFVLDGVNVRAAPVSGTNLVRYGPLVYSDALRAELREQRQRLAARANELQDAPETALKAPGACVRYNDLCPYFDICHADPEDREALVQIAIERSKLERRAWVPSARDTSDA